VPTHALTLTIPALLNTPFAFAIVPGEKKADAVKHTLNAAISEKYPSTILRTHPDATLFVDDKSGTYI
jgi:glucosamine-6-phosphate deaminase